MILSKPDILRRLRPGGVEIEPAPGENRVGPVSINLRLGRKFTTFAPDFPRHITSIQVEPSVYQSVDLWRHAEDQDHFDLTPEGFVLAQTLEVVTIPPDLMGLLEGRSSWARIGLGVHLTAPKIDPGFTGTIVLEISNVGPATVRLRAEVDEPAQLMLLPLSTPLDPSDVYGADESDVFQFQSDPIPRQRQ